MAPCTIGSFFQQQQQEQQQQQQQRRETRCQARGAFFIDLIRASIYAKLLFNCQTSNPFAKYCESPSSAIKSTFNSFRSFR
jgi:hypothetical protein